MLLDYTISVLKKTVLFYICDNWGHSTTTGTKFYSILTPPTSSGQKWTFHLLSALWHMTHLGLSTDLPIPFFLFNYLEVIEWPLLCDNSGTLYWTLHAVGVYGLGFYFLFKLILLYCDRSMIKLLKHFLSFN